MTHLFGNSCCLENAAHYITYIVDSRHNVSIDRGGHRQAGIIKNLLKYGRGGGMYVFVFLFYLCFFY